MLDEDYYVLTLAAIAQRSEANSTLPLQDYY